MWGFLRYSSRHHFFWRLSGPDGVGMGVPRLDPVDGMVYGVRYKNISWHEPLWLFRLRQRLFAFAGRQRCGRRDDMFAWSRGDGPQPDTWDWGPDGNRTCSYCGSIHPDDLMKICELVLDDERYAIEGTTKSYKVYVRQPGVVNASQGAIKFYMQHAHKDPSEEQKKLFADACRVSRERFEAQMAAWRTERAAAG